MDKINFKGLIKTTEDFITKRSPEILTGIGIAGMVTTTILAVKATPKALRLIEEEKMFKEKEAHEGGIFTEDDEQYAFKLTSFEIVKATWKCYIPAAITCTASIACLVGASSVNFKRNAALATAYKLSETALSEYKDAVIETIGEKKEQIVKDKMSEKKLKEEPVTKNQVILTEKGNTLCYDYHSGRYFKSDIDTIKKAVNEINSSMIRDDYASLNEFYDEIGLPHTEVGGSLGWNINDGLLEVYFSSKIADDGTPCIVMSYETQPKHGYNRYS